MTTPKVVGQPCHGSDARRRCGVVPTRTNKQSTPTECSKLSSSQYGTHSKKAVGHAAADEFAWQVVGVHPCPASSLQPSAPMEGCSKIARRVLGVHELDGWRISLVICSVLMRRVWVTKHDVVMSCRSGIRADRRAALDEHVRRICCIQAALAVDIRTTRCLRLVRANRAKQFSR